MRKSTLRAVIGALLILCTAWLIAATLDAPGSLPPAVAQGNEPIPLHPHAVSWIDHGGARRITDIETAGDSMPWQARKAEQIDRIEGKALWIAFDIRTTDPTRWFLEVGVAGIDKVELFYRAPNGQLVSAVSGDVQPISSWPVPGRYPTFPLYEGEPRTTRYFLRIENSRLDFAAPLTLYPVRTLLSNRDREQFLLGAYFGLAALLALAAFASGVAYRDRAFRAFALYLAVIGASQLARAGIGAEHVWPNSPYWNDLAIYAWPGLPVAAALWFVRIVVEPARLSRTLDVGVMGLVAAVLLAVAVAAVLGTRMSMVLVLVLTGFSLAAVAGTLAWGWVDGRDRNIRLVALAFLPVVLLALFPLARSFNLVPISIMTRNAIFFGTVLQMPILYYALQVRSVRRRESELRAAALSTTDPLTGLPHRPAFVERLNTTLTRARNHKHVFALFGVRAANLDAIAEEFGRDVAEKALVVAASHLRRVTTDTDMVARVGEQDFAMLLEGPLDNTIAVSRAQQVVASGLRQVDALPAAATLKFFVTVALLPHNSLDGLATLQWVQEALNQMTPDAKKLIRPLNF